MTSADVKSQILAAAQKYGVDPTLALAVAAHESGFNPTATHQNSNGTTDWGVFQLNDTTVRTLNVSDPLDPSQNIDAGVRLLGMLSNQYSGDLQKTLWAYSAGAGSVASGKMPASVPSYIDWVTNYMAQNQVQSPEGSGDMTDTQAGIFDSIDPLTLAIGGALLLVFAGWYKGRG